MPRKATQIEYPTVNARRNRSWAATLCCKLDLSSRATPNRPNGPRPFEETGATAGSGRVSESGDARPAECTLANVGGHTAATRLFAFMTSDRALHRRHSRPAFLHRPSLRSDSAIGMDGWRA